MTTTTLTPPPSGTIQVWSDLLCPFAAVALHRLRAARAHNGIELQVDHHVFALELFNGPHPRRGTDTEAVGLGQVEPGAELRVWTAADDLYPHTVLLAAEAVLAAKEQGLTASEALDTGLRRAFWTRSRSISHRAVILDVAEQAGLDVRALADALDGGRHRRRLFDDHAVASTDAIGGSPTFVLPDGSAVTNPGIDVHWQGEWAVGFPVVDRSDPTEVEDLVRWAAA